jgi:threonine dehydrogenase-like Zn-dependent dehydrogenase
VPFGAAFAKGLTFRMGQTHVHRYLRPLLERIRAREIDPASIVSHRLPAALRYTKRRPATALLIAGAVGLTLGRLVKRRS